MASVEGGKRWVYRKRRREEEHEASTITVIPRIRVETIQGTFVGRVRLTLPKKKRRIESWRYVCMEKS